MAPSVVALDENSTIPLMVNLISKCDQITTFESWRSGPWAEDKATWFWIFEKGDHAVGRLLVDLVTTLSVIRLLAGFALLHTNAPSSHLYCPAYSFSLSALYSAPSFLGISDKVSHFSLTCSPSPFVTNLDLKPRSVRPNTAEPPHLFVTEIRLLLTVALYV